MTFLDRITYRPGVQIDVRHQAGIPFVVISEAGFDSNNPSGRYTRTMYKSIPEHMPEEYLHHWIRGVFLEFETHEVSEWLRIDGKRLDDPHDI